MLTLNMMMMTMIIQKEKSGMGLQNQKQYAVFRVTKLCMSWDVRAHKSVDVMPVWAMWFDFAQCSHWGPLQAAMNVC